MVSKKKKKLCKKKKNSKKQGKTAAEESPKKEVQDESKSKKKNNKNAKDEKENENENEEEEESDKEEKCIEIGSIAPNKFTEKILNDKGEEFNINKHKGKYVVIFFYPKDNTPGCTKENCTFRDLKSKFDELNTIIIGVSGDNVNSHVKFIEKCELNFSLIADTNREIMTAYGAINQGKKNSKINSCN